MNLNPASWGKSLTFRRIFPAALFLMIFALAVRQSAVIDPDLWWHLQTGQHIVESGSIPRTDIFSYTKAGSEWVTHEWLSEVFIYGVYRVAGWGGLVFLFPAFICLALIIAYRRCEGRPYAASLAMLLAAASSSPLFGVRPQMFTFLLASVYLYLLGRYASEREGDGARRALWWTVPLMLLWVNLHAGFALGLAFIGLYMVSLALDGQWKLLPRLALVLAACTAVVPLNPHGFRMFSYPYETLTSSAMAAFINEWASPNFHEDMFLPMAGLLCATIFALAMSPRRAKMGEIFLVLVTCAGALRSARHIPIFALVAAPVFATHLWSLMTERGWARWFTSPEVPAVGLRLAINLAFLLAPATLGAVRLWHFTTYQRSYEARSYPAAAVDYLQAERLPGPIYNQYGWGGYLIRRLHPDYPVFIDGRADVYGDAFMIKAMKTYDGFPQWREPLDDLAVRTVLIPPDVPLASLLREDAGWGKVYEDKVAVIFTRRDSEAPDTAPATRPPDPVPPTAAVEEEPHSRRHQKEIYALYRKSE